MHIGFLRLRLSLAILLLVTSGCFSPWVNDQSDEISTRRDGIREALESEDRPTIIAEIGSPGEMLSQTLLENIGLVTQLRETGGKVNASSQRTKMLDTMRHNDTDSPNSVLDDPSTAMVVVSAVVAPAARRGDVHDVMVKLSTHAEGTDLEHGRLLKTPLVEMKRLAGRVHQGFEHMAAEGSVVTERQITGRDDDDPKATPEGIIVGGGRLLKSRQLEIRLNSQFADAITMAAVVPAINRRFTYFDGRIQAGIATPKGERSIEIVVPPTYRHDPFHLINVVLQIGFNETTAQRTARMETLRKQLQEPTTVRTACWQLEAIGESAVPILASVLNHPNSEIRFYAAHSLAYLNDSRAIPALVSLCLQEPAFRAMCFNGLVAIESFEASDALRELLHAADAETKYGAVLALRERDSSDPQVTGSTFGKTGIILDIPSAGAPLVAVSLSKVPEVAIFGTSPTLHLPSFQYVNPHIIVSATGNDLSVSHFQPGQPDQIVTSKNDLRSVLSAISDVGGTYGDWVSFVRECHENGYFMEPFAMNPIPKSGRTYNRKPANEFEPGDEMYGTTIFDTSEDDVQSTLSESVWYNPLSWGN